MFNNPIEIDFANVTPKPAPKPFSQKFIEAMEKEPRTVTVTFKQDGYELALKTSFRYEGSKEKEEISTQATKELIFAILCAFNDDMTKIEEYNPTGKEVISTQDDEEDLHVKMYKTFLASPYQRIDMKMWRPDPECDPGNRWFSIRFPVAHARFVSFSLPNYHEMHELWLEAKRNNIGNNK